MKPSVYELTETEAAYVVAALAIAVHDESQLLSAFDRRCMVTLCQRLAGPLSLSPRELPWLKLVPVSGQG
ncbi:MAG: hypothetical protein JSS38_11145 [Nitrospira sp.]|nr:hypothetical protein [Nitrospira sp.]